MIAQILIVRTEDLAVVDALAPDALTSGTLTEVPDGCRAMSAATLAELRAAAAPARAKGKR